MSVDDYSHITMDMKILPIPAGQFKAKCLAILDEVSLTGQTYIVTKRGKPVAKVVPIDPPEPDSLLGSVLSEGDIISPVDETWNADG